MKNFKITVLFKRLSISNLAKMNQFIIKNKVRILFFFLLFFLNGYTSGQSRVEKQFAKAQQFFISNEFKNAISEAEKVLKTDPSFAGAALLLSDIYHDMDSTAQEIKYLEHARQYSENPIIFVRLGEAFYRSGEYLQALENFENYIQKGVAAEKRKNEIERKMGNCRFAVEAIKNPVEFEPEKLNSNINTADDEYWPSLSIDQQKLVFTRLIKKNGTVPQEDFYSSESDSTGWGPSRPLSEINTSLNEGAQIFSVDEKILFFTACNRPDGKGSCDIYYSVWKDGRWSAPKNAGNPVNTNQWEAQPGFSSDNRYLYFSGNRPGGSGNKDIWRVELLSCDENGELKWGEPENPGTQINTPGDEISPFIHPNNRSLYFASNYHTGMGGFDLFVSEKNYLNSFSEPQNLGYPINTFNDEQGLNISADGKTAYFASARGTDTGLDIYSFHLSEEMQPDPVTYVKARVFDKKTKQPVSAQVDLFRISGEEEKILSENVGENGEILLCLPLGENYAFHVSEEQYLFYSQAFSLVDQNASYNPYLLDIELEPVEIGAEMDLYNIYFETDSFMILPPSEPELQKLARFLTDNPELTVEIQGHTDNSGLSEKNQRLSELRAKSVVEYLLNRGIATSRMLWKGYGDTKPVAENETIEGRRLNRRTTVKIVAG